MKTFRRMLVLPLLLCLVACSISPAVAIAVMGIAGAGLTSYCLSGGSGCSPEVVAYGALITKEAIRDAVVIESGKTTLAQLQQIVANLQQDIDQGNALAGLSSGQQAEVSAVVAAVDTVLTITEALIAKTPVPPGSSAGARVSPSAIAVKLPALSRHDKAELQKMRNRIVQAGGVK